MEDSFIPEDNSAPHYIRTIHDLNRSIRIGETTESITLDFKVEIALKEVSKSKKAETAEELALDICQFANTFGGVLLVGVKEEQEETTGRKVASQYVNVTNFNDLSEFLSNNVLHLIYPPDINIEVSLIFVEQSKHIIAINVFPLSSGASCVYSNTPPYLAKYPYRTHYGKKYLHPSEVEKRMSHGDRRILIKLREMSSITKEVIIYPEVEKLAPLRSDSWDSKGINTIIKNITNHEYTLSINGITINIPFSLTKDVWLTEKGLIGILLGTRLSISADRKSIQLNL